MGYCTKGTKARTLRLTVLTHILLQPRVSCSSPLRSSEHYSRAKFVEEFQLAREQVSRFRNKMHGLAKQIDGIEADIVSIQQQWINLIVD